MFVSVLLHKFENQQNCLDFIFSLLQLSHVRKESQTIPQILPGIIVKCFANVRFLKIGTDLHSNNKF